MILSAGLFTINTDMKNSRKVYFMRVSSKVGTDLETILTKSMNSFSRITMFWLKLWTLKLLEKGLFLVPALGP